jgi:hypothetical protein
MIFDIKKGSGFGEGFSFQFQVFSQPAAGLRLCGWA